MGCDSLYRRMYVRMQYLATKDIAVYHLSCKLFVSYLYNSSLVQDGSRKKLRHQKKYRITPSPLMTLKWWRVSACVTNGPLNFDVFLSIAYSTCTLMYVRTYKEVVCIHKYVCTCRLHTYVRTCDLYL